MNKTHDEIVEEMHLAITDDDMIYRGPSALRRAIKPLLDELDSWKALRDVSLRVIPDEDGEMEEQDPTPASIREHLVYLSGEWDNAEKRIVALETRVKELAKLNERMQS